MRPCAERALEVLRAADRAMSAKEIAEAMGIRRSSAGRIRKWLLELAGDELSTHERFVQAGCGAKRPAVYFQIKRPPAKLTDLWRGWTNPATGFQPPRLGAE